MPLHPRGLDLSCGKRVPSSLSLMGPWAGGASASPRACRETGVSILALLPLEPSSFSVKQAAEQGGDGGRQGGAQLREGLLELACPHREAWCPGSLWGSLQGSLRGMVAWSPGQCGRMSHLDQCGPPGWPDCRPRRGPMGVIPGAWGEVAGGVIQRELSSPPRITGCTPWPNSSLAQSQAAGGWPESTAGPPPRVQRGCRGEWVGGGTR